MTPDKNIRNKEAEAQRISAIMKERMPKNDMERMEVVSDQQKGLREVAGILKDIATSGAKAVGMGLLLVSWLDNRRTVTEETTAIYNKIGSLTPGIDMAQASICLAKLTPYIIERLMMAARLHPELFDIQNMGESIEIIADEL